MKDLNDIKVISNKILRAILFSDIEAVAHPEGFGGLKLPLLKPNTCFKVKCPNCASAIMLLF